MDKLNILARSEGKGLEAMLEDAMLNDIAPGICSNASCDYTTIVEPDCMNGYCESCGTQTVESCLIIAGMI